MAGKHSLNTKPNLPCCNPSGALYAGYTVVMKLKMPGEEEDAQVALFFG
jgi:hypothetical protein